MESLLSFAQWLFLIPAVNSLALLPLRDIATLISWALAFTKKTVIWRGTKLILTQDGHLAWRASSR